MSRLRMDGYCCGLAAHGPVAPLIRACLERAGLAVTSVDPADLATAACDADIVLVDVDQFGDRALSAAADVPVIRMASRPEELACTCGREDVCLCRIGLPFSPPALVMRVRAALAAAHGVPASPPSRDTGRLALDLCSGSGLSTCEAADADGPGMLVVGVDRSPEAVIEAMAMARLIGYANVVYVAAYVVALPFRDGSFDALSGEEELADRLGDPEALDRTRAEVRRVTR